MRRKWKMAVASLKMYIRQREAMLWSFLFPLMIVVLFSFVHFDGMGAIGIGIVRNGNTALAETLVDGIRKMPSCTVHEGDREQELRELQKGERDLVLIVPVQRDSASPSLQVFVNDERRQQSEIGMLLIQQVLDRMVFVQNHMPGRFTLVPTTVQSRNLTYIDFLLPGIISMSIMQMGVFGVAFGFVSLKRRGILRRLSVAPIHANDFIVPQVAIRVLVTVLQIGLMIGLGILFLHLHFVGSLFSMLIVGILGATVFLGIGFSIAGICKSEDEVAPLANVVTLPMLLFGGVFFSRATFPGFIRVVTDLFPLSFLADALRAIAIDGAGLLHVGPQLLGLAVWGLITCGLAVKVFRWE